jgi:hypothetical protein
MGEQRLYWNIGVMEWWKNREWNNGGGRFRCPKMSKTDFAGDPLFHCCSEYTWVIYDRLLG